MEVGCSFLEVAYAFKYFILRINFFYCFWEGFKKKTLYKNYLKKKLKAT